MKIAVSIPDHLFEDAEHLARIQGKSRSRLYSDALSAYVESHRSQNVTDRLDEVYKDREKSLDAVFSTPQYRVLQDEGW